MNDQVEQAINRLQQAVSDAKTEQETRLAKTRLAYALFAYGDAAAAKRLAESIPDARADTDLAALLDFVAFRRGHDTPDAYAYLAHKPVKIDGKLNEWDMHKSKLPQAVWSGESGPGFADTPRLESPEEMKAYVAYDSENLYFAFDVRDDSPVNGSRTSHWEGSEITLLLDIPNYKSLDYRSGIHNFWFAPAPPYVGMMSNVPGVPPLKTDTDAKGIPFVLTRTPHGYVAEIALPNKVVPKFDPDRFPKMTFNYVVRSYRLQGAGSRQHKTLWRSQGRIISLINIFYQPFAWGTIEFKR